jgi:quercetin dioxygenase-like cupin family protein
MIYLATTLITFSFIGLVSAYADQPKPEIKITKARSQAPTKGSADNFTGQVKIEPLFQPNESSRTSGAMVTFEPGARTAWHTHPLGQILIVTEGTGYVQQWGGSIQKIQKGDVVWTPPGVKHWHGATPKTSMTHIAIQEFQNGKNVDWMEKVSDEQYQQVNGISQ